MKYIYGNWKMNCNLSDLKKYLDEMNNLKVSDKVKYGIAVSPTMLAAAREIANDNIVIACQNMHFEDKGAFTGEVSALQLKDINVDTTLIGHSERRQYFAETDAIINKKVLQAKKHGINSVVCFGETLDEYEAKKSKDVVKKQLTEALKGIKDLNGIGFAYEPVWAIGTGKTATAEYAEEMCAYSREVLTELLNKEEADNTFIQYGGSVKGANAKEILSKANIGGALVGGASLKMDDFKLILEAYK